MWQGIVSTNKWNLSCYSPRILVHTAVSFGLSWFVYGGRGASAAGLVDTAVDESKRKMEDRVARSRARLCNRDGEICDYRRIGYDFLTFWFLFYV